MLKERDLGRNIKDAVIRASLAALTATGLVGVNTKPVGADINEPVRYQQGEGQWVADAPLRTRDRAVLFYGPDGLGACGVDYDGPTLLIARANEDNMNLKVTGKSGVFVDPIEVGGDDYASRAAAAVIALNEKAVQLPTGTRRVGVLTTRDAVEQTVCDLVTDSGPLVSSQGLGTLTAVLPDLILRCGQSVPLSFAIGELRAVGYPGPSDAASVQAAENRTVNCGGPIRLAEVVTGNCNPPDITALAARQSAFVNGFEVSLGQFRDKTFGCERALLQKETGVRKGENLRTRIPSGWAVIVSATSLAVHPEGGVQQDFTNGDVVIVRGVSERMIGIGIWEGWWGVVPDEWVTRVAAERLALQVQQTGKPQNVVVYNG